MQAIKFPEANVNLEKPKDMTDEQCSSLAVYRTTIGDLPVMISKWQPSKQELVSLVAGANVELTVVGVTHPPVSITVDNMRNAD